MIRDRKPWIEQLYDIFKASKVVGGGIAVYDAVHAKTHEQKAYSFHRLELDVGNNANLDIGITPQSPLHIVFSSTATAASRAFFYEGAEITGGTSLTNFNRDRERGTDDGVATTVFGPTVNSLGTQISADVVPGGDKNRAVGGAATTFSEWILDAGTTYLFRVTNVSGGGEDISVIGYFYEE